MTYKKKLIEVALPLEAINREAAREKSIRHGHPSTLHLWWARRPLAACRAVLFASLVDDPSAWPDRFPTEEAQEKERQRIFRIIEELVKWENSNNERVLNAAKAEIARSLAWNRGDTPPATPEQVQAYLNRHAPPVYDPFCGGGSIPLEAQRLGLEAHASDLNPVPVLINKALIEIPPKFAGKPPVNPQDNPTANQRESTRMGKERKDAGSASDSRPLASIRGSNLLSHSWKGAAGLAADIRYYGQWMRDEAEKRIGHLYPKVKAVQERDGSYRHATPEEIAGSADKPTANPRESTRMKDAEAKAEHHSRHLASIRGSKIEQLTVIAWLWARTVASPNPAAKGAYVPLVRSFWLSTKPGKKAWIEPVVDQSTMTYRFEVRTGNGEPRPGTMGKAGDYCLLTGTPLTREYIRTEGKAGRMRARLMAVVAEGARGRIYLPPCDHHEAVAASAQPAGELPDTDIVGDMRYLTPVSYGMTKHRHLFTNRQLVALTTFCDLVGEARQQVLRDAGSAGIPAGEAQAYADAVATYLAFTISKLADLANSLCAWEPAAQCPRHLFSRQAIPIAWDFAEGNPLGQSSGSWAVLVEAQSRSLIADPMAFTRPSGGQAVQRDAKEIRHHGDGMLFSTDPPYYDNVPYADLSDFFYVWLRRCLRPVYPDLLGTLLVPKAEELVADPFRHGGKEEARSFFERGMGRVFERMRESGDPRFPTTIYYAFKQAENDEAGNAGFPAGDSEEEDAGTDVGAPRASTGWETFLQGLVDAGWQIDGTWPMRTECVSRMRSMASNALASSIVLVCRPRPKDAGVASRRDFLAALKRELPEALRHLQKGNIAPVDLAQAAIGPGMAVFSRYAKVLETDGSTMSVRSALTEINKCLDEVLAEQEGEFDADTRWALAWFDQYGFTEGPYGVAETLCTAKNTSVQGMKEAGILEAKGGKVRLLKKEELDADWNPAEDSRLTIWEITHHLIRRLEQGESGAAELIQQLGAKAEVARDLSYRLYTICERRKWAQEAIAYNALVLSWGDVQRLAEERKAVTPTQGEMNL